MTEIANILVVEDDKEWCAAYRRAADREELRGVRIAEDLASARALIDDMQFAVAFVNVGLNVGDDQNVDGLKVMEKIRSVGDATSVIVVTGRSGRDVLPITRDAIMKYDAYEIVGKSDISPQDIRRLLRDGITAFKNRKARMGDRAPTALQGSLEPWLWDDQVLRATQANVGAKALYEFLDGLLHSYLPLVSEKQGEPTIIEPTGMVHGNYWSRSLGTGIVVVFSEITRGEKVIGEAKRTGSLLGKYSVTSTLSEYVHGQLRGAVFGLRSASRRDFGKG